jgi:hypothetical protein
MLLTAVLLELKEPESWSMFHLLRELKHAFARHYNESRVVVDNI